MDNQATQLPEKEKSLKIEAYEPPTFRVINLSCEIGAYTPLDEDFPLF